MPGGSAVCGQPLKASRVRIGIAIGKTVFIIRRFIILRLRGTENQTIFFLDVSSPVRRGKIAYGIGVPGILYG